MKKDNIKLSIFWVFSFLVIIFMMSFSAAAEEAPSYPLYIDSEMNPTDLSLEEIRAGFTMMWGDLPESYILYCNGIDQSYKNGPNGWDYYDYYNFIVAVDPIFEYPLTLDINSSYYYITNTVEYSFNYYTHSSSFSAFQVNSNVRSQKAYYYIAQGLGYILYGTEEEYTSTDDVVVWAYRHNDPVINTGVAVAPPNFIVPEYFTGDSAPTSVPPSYTINNYTWTTAPSFDGSSVINGIQSIKDTLEWLADNLKNSFSNLITNLKGFVEYIGKTIQYYGNAIIETLNNLIQNFYDNMKALVENISNQIDYIKQPLDQDVIWDNISTTSLVTNISTINTSLTSFQGAFTGVSEPNEYKIPIHLENLPSSWFGTQTTQYIDLGIINGTVKDGLRLFVWAMVTYGLVVTIFDSIANYINGGGDES